MAATENPSFRERRERRCRRTVESMPPDSATATRSAFRGFLELAIVHQPLEPFLHQLARFFLLQLLEHLGERLAQRLRARLRVAMRAAERLRHDLVDQAERLQPARRNGKR